MVLLDQRELLTDVTLWRPRVHQGIPWTERPPPSQALAGRGHQEQIAAQKKKKTLIKHQAGLGITMLSVDTLSRATINSGSCRQGRFSVVSAATIF